jgi:hypothetical protein
MVWASHRDRWQAQAPGSVLLDGRLCGLLLADDGGDLLGRHAVKVEMNLGG